MADTLEVRIAHLEGAYEQIDRRLAGVETGLAQLRQQIDTPDPQAESILTLTHNRLLVLDDVGKQKDTEWVVEQFYLLLNTLCAQGKQLLITTNRTPARLYQGLDPALASRLTTLCHQVVLKGADRRLQASPNTGALR